MESMRVLLADDHGLVQETISAYLSSEGQAEVVTASDYNEATKMIDLKGPFDIVVLDFNMPGMNGLKGLTEAIRKYPDQPFAILSGTAGNKIAQSALEAGAVGFLPKTMGARSLLNAVRFMIAGETFVPTSLIADDDDDVETVFSKQLSRREKQVLRELCKGASNKEIARDLKLQEVTIKLHVRTLSKKLNVKNRTQAAMAAKEAGFE
jgi:DNA-binding NarL/FixJ family response regulator